MLDMKERANKKQDQPRERLGTNLNVWLPPELMEAFDALRGKTRRTKTAEVVVMMEEYLAKHGEWPRRRRDNGA